jgi:hypothetical protein
MGLHPVHTAVLAPPAERLAFVVEQNAKQTPKEDQRGIGHNGWDEPGTIKSALQASQPQYSIERGTYPSSKDHGVINLENPYPHTFLLTVMLTNRLPATGLYESTAYVLTIDGRAAT